MAQQIWPVFCAPAPLSRDGDGVGRHALATGGVRRERAGG
eukprot:SAG11_NODE_846_length_6884_cov_5.651732_11_plen_39_part_01